MELTVLNHRQWDPLSPIGRFDLGAKQQLARNVGMALVRHLRVRSCFSDCYCPLFTSQNSDAHLKI